MLLKKQKLKIFTEVKKWKTERENLKNIFLDHILSQA